MQPHLTRTLAGALQPGSEPDDWPALGLTEQMLHDVREGMWAVVNEPGGTAPLARRDPTSSWPERPVPPRCAGYRASCARAAISTAKNCPGNTAPTPSSSPSPHTMRPRYALAVVIEHGNAGAAAAAPIAREIMTDVLHRDPSNRSEPPPAQVAEAKT